MRLDRPAPTDALERWAVDVGPADVARIEIPPHAQRDRQFEVSCHLKVTGPADAEGAWHALEVLIDGRQRWLRRVATQPGADSLDYRFRHTVPAGEALRLVVSARVNLSQRTQLFISAEEESPD